MIISTSNSSKDILDETSICITDKKGNVAFSIKEDEYGVITLKGHYLVNKSKFTYSLNVKDVYRNENPRQYSDPSSGVTLFIETPIGKDITLIAVPVTDSPKG